MLATLPASDLLSSSSSLDRDARPRRGVGGSVSIGGGLTRPDGVVSKEFRPALVKADGGSRLGPWLRVERALSGWPASASGLLPWPRAEPARMVGGFRRLALVRGVSSSVRCAAVAMVAAVGRRYPVGARACAEALRARSQPRMLEPGLPRSGGAFSAVGQLLTGFPPLRTGTDVVWPRPQRQCR